MRLTLKTDGDFAKLLEGEGKRLKRAFRKGVADTTTGLKTELRGQVSKAGLGKKLANTWRGNVYPKPGVETYNPAGVVFCKAPVIVRAFDEGAVIRSRDGFFLAIPTDAAPKRGTGGKRINPSNFPEHVYGPLRFVYRAKGPSLLVVDNLRARGGKRGGFSRASQRSLRTGEKLTTVVMFFLVRQVKLKKHLNIDAAVRQWEQKFPLLISRNLL